MTNTYSSPSVKDVVRLDSILVKRLSSRKQRLRKLTPAEDDHEQAPTRCAKVLLPDVW